MRCRLFNKQPENLKKFLCFGISFSVLSALTVFVITLSFVTFIGVLGIAIASVFIFALFDFLKVKLSHMKIRVLPVVLAVLLTLSSAVVFMVNYNYEMGLSSVFTHQKKITDAEELLEYNGKYKNVVLELDTDSLFETEYRVEKIISQKDNTESDKSGIWDNDEWISNIISERKVLYKYYVLPFDGKYFVAKISAEMIEYIESNKGLITLECLASAPASNDASVCESICNDVNKVLYKVDHFEGEADSDYYDDLEAVKGESTVMVTVEKRNLTCEAILVSATIGLFVLGVLYLLFMILYAPALPKLSKTKK